MKKRSFLKHVLVGGTIGGVVIGGIYALIMGFFLYIFIIKGNEWSGLDWLAFSRGFNPIFWLMNSMNIDLGLPKDAITEKNFYLVSTFFSVMVGILIGSVFGMFIYWPKKIKLKNK